MVETTTLLYTAFPHLLCLFAICRTFIIYLIISYYTSTYILVILVLSFSRACAGHADYNRSTLSQQPVRGYAPSHQHQQSLQCHQPESSLCVPCHLNPSFGAAQINMFNFNDKFTALVQFYDSIETISQYGCVFCLVNLKPTTKTNTMRNSNLHSQNHCQYKKGRCYCCGRMKDPLCERGASNCGWGKSLPPNDYCYWCGWHFRSMDCGARQPVPDKIFTIDHQHSVDHGSFNDSPLTANRRNRLKYLETYSKDSDDKQKGKGLQSITCKSGLRDIMKQIVFIHYEDFLTSHQSKQLAQQHGLNLQNLNSVDMKTWYLGFCFPSRQNMTQNSLPGFVAVINHYVQYKLLSRPFNE